MDISKLFEAQQALDEHIINEHPELLENESNLDWKLLALQVEIGECANEWRGFKKWSKDQSPRTLVLMNNPDKTDKRKPWLIRNLLLEEYVDCLHLILSIGIELGFDQQADESIHEQNIKVYTETDTIYQFQQIFNSISELDIQENKETYEEVFLYFLGLGTHLGFTWEQVEAAYFEKNKVNHDRQANGY